MPRLRAPLLLAGAVALAYFNALFGPFQFDDYNVIVHNPAVTHWPPEPGGLRPLLKLSYALNWRADPDAFGFHLFNVLLHALNAILVFALGARLAASFLEAPAARRAALVGALLFALHPAQTEAVTYISGRSTSLMTFFYLGSVLAYARGRERGRPGLTWFISPLLFACALLTKEAAVTLPVALLLWQACSGRDGPSALKGQWAHWALLLAALALMSRVPAYRDLLALAPGMDTLRTQIAGVSYLLSRGFVLGGLNIDPDLRLQAAWNAALVTQAVALLSLLAVGLWALRVRPWWGFGLLWLFLQLLPGNTLILRWDVANERQLYLASVGVCIAAGVEGERLRALWPRAAPFMIAALLSVLALFTVLRNQDYRSEVALWEDAARKSPDKPRVHNNLGDAYRQAGKLDAARASFRRALALDPDYLLAGNNLRALEEGQAAAPR